MRLILVSSFLLLSALLECHAASFQIYLFTFDKLTKVIHSGDLFVMWVCIFFSLAFFSALYLWAFLACSIIFMLQACRCCLFCCRDTHAINLTSTTKHSHNKSNNDTSVNSHIIFIWNIFRNRRLLIRLFLSISLSVSIPVFFFFGRISLCDDDVNSDQTESKWANRLKKKNMCSKWQLRTARIGWRRNNGQHRNQTISNFISSFFFRSSFLLLFRKLIFWMECV